MLTKRMLFGVTASLTVLAGALVTLASQTEPAPHPQAGVAVTGQVTSAAEGLMEGVVVTAKREGSTIAVSVISDAQGRYRFPAGRLEAGRHTFTARAVGYDLEAPIAAGVGMPGMATVDLRLHPTQDLEAQLTNAEWLESIPGTEAHVRVLCALPYHRSSHAVAIRCGRLAARPGTNGWLCDIGFPGQPAKTSRRPGDTVRRAERAVAGSPAAAGGLSGHHQFELRQAGVRPRDLPPSYGPVHSGHHYGV